MKLNTRLSIYLSILLITAWLLSACAAVQQAAQGESPQVNQAVSVQSIQSLYEKLGGEKGILGAPVSVGLEQAGSGWAMWHYGRGRIYSNPQRGTFEVYGAIMNKWLALGGGNGPLGYPAGHPQEGSGDKAIVQTFQNASLSWQGCGEVHVLASPSMLKVLEKVQSGLLK
jgi:uncharacterized protein with LGFP repeats